jgi:Glyoxalase/Bleomycin resistance protein/Dioxygenase superfamily
MLKPVVIGTSVSLVATALTAVPNMSASSQKGRSFFSSTALRSTITMGQSVIRMISPTATAMLLWFEIDDFDAAIARAAEIRAEVVMPCHRNPPSGDGGPNHWECWFRDPDGYTVVLASPDGSAR